MRKPIPIVAFAMFVAASGVAIAMLAAATADAATWQRLVRVNGPDGKPILSYQLDAAGVRWERDPDGKDVVVLPVRRIRGAPKDLLVWVVDVERPNVNECRSCGVGFAPWPSAGQTSTTLLRIVVPGPPRGRYVALAMIGDAWNGCGLTIAPNLGRP